MYFVLVKGQSLEVKPNPVTGVFGKSVDITWTIGKKDENDTIGNTRLYLGDSVLRQNLLYRGASPLDKLELAQSRFGDRIKASLEGEIYLLKLSNLSYNDTVWLTLAVNQEDANLNPRPVSIKSVQISKVKGMHFLRRILQLMTCFILQEDKTGYG